MEKLVIFLVNGETILLREDDLVTINDDIIDEYYPLEEVARDMTNPHTGNKSSDNIINYFVIITTSSTYYLPKKSIVYAKLQ